MSGNNAETSVGAAVTSACHCWMMTTLPDCCGFWVVCDRNGTDGHYSDGTVETAAISLLRHGHMLSEASAQAPLHD